VRADAPPGSSWGVWDDARLGTLNLLTPERVLAAVGSIRTGRTFGLSLELTLPSPPMFGRPALVHEVRGRPTGAKDDVYNEWNTQSSAQWDGFRHYPHPEHGPYGGIADEAHGVDAWAERGIVGRGLLVDVDRWRTSVGRPLQQGTPDDITAADLRDAIAAQGTEPQVGDILLLRTGWLTWYRGLDEGGRVAAAEGHGMAAPGLAGMDAVALVWDLHVSALCADNPAVEAVPLRRPNALHDQLLPLLGIPLGEMWDLDALAADCAADGTYDCFVAAVPLRMPQGIASPPNAVAVR
jgi:hypothetical protein